MTSSNRVSIQVPVLDAYRDDEDTVVLFTIINGRDMHIPMSMRDAERVLTRGYIEIRDCPSTEIN